MSDRRLIEEGLPLAHVNEESAREKSLRHGHISTMHLWWARRPLTMSRAVVFGTLLPDPEDDEERSRILKLVAEAASFEASVKAERIGPLKELLSEAYEGRPPSVLDCFAGGGAIPLEALRLGCDVTATDLNPVAYLIEKCVLEYPQRFGHGSDGSNLLAEQFLKWSDWIRSRLEPEFAPLFPSQSAHRPTVYFWARTMTCPEPACRAEIPLLSTFWIANSSRRTVWVEVSGRPGQVDLRLRNGTPPEGLDLSRGTVKASSVTCPACNNTLPAKEVRSYGKKTGFGARLYGVLEIVDGIRSYRDPNETDLKGPRLAAEAISSLEELPDGTSALPDEPVDAIGYINLQNLVFGFKTWRSLFNHRQLNVLGMLSKGVRDAHQQMLKEDMDPDLAKAVATYLGLLVDKIADYESSFTTWASGGEFPRSTFPRQAIAMSWDYVEIYPFPREGGIWASHTRWIELAIRHCASTGSVPARVQRANAQELPYPDDTFDAVIIDPPYYFSIMFSDLSDFFYVWLKRSVGHLYPDQFVTQWTPKDTEVIQNRTNPKDPRYISSEEFERRLERSLREIVRVAKGDALVSIVFAHTDVTAWERLLRALRSVGLIVSTSWPMRSERAGRQLAQVKAALGSSVVLVCRFEGTQREGFYDDVVRALESRIADRLEAFGAMGLVGADYFVSAVGPAFEVFARYSKVTKLSGEEVDVSDLMVLARQTVARHAMRRLLGEDTLTALDAPSLFYLTWRWAYLTTAIPADEAYKLERAFEVDLGTLSRPGGFVKRAGANFSALGPDERKDIKLSASPSLVDVLHIACRLWDSARRKELEQLLGATGLGAKPGFWATARALAEVLPDGSAERRMLLGLTGNRDALSAAAAKSTSSIEELTLFGSET